MPRTEAKPTKKSDSTKAKSDSSKIKADKDSKKNTSLRLDKKTLKALKIHAIENDTSVQKLIESMIIDYLAKHKK